MNSIDFIVVVVMAVSILLAVLRGFTREVLTIAAWVGATFAVLYGLPLARPLFLTMFDSPTMANIVAAGVIGIVTLIILSLISNQIAKMVKKSGLGAVDRSLGAFFGALRGAILLCLIYILVEYLMQPLPPTVEEARFQPLLADGAEYLKSIAPPDFAGVALPKPDEPPMQDLTPPVPPAAVEKDEHGYHDRERNGMNDLLENATPDAKGAQH